MRRWLLCCALFVVLGCAGVAQSPAVLPDGSGQQVSVPHLIRFSGALKDGSGAALQGTVGITFALYNDQQGGNALWIETQNISLDAGGRYSALLGATAAEGLPMELFASGEARWLGIHVDGQADQPRVLLVSVPYALKAGDAETVAGRPLSSFVLAGENTGTGKDGLNYLNTKIFNSSVNTDAVTNASSGTAGYLGKFFNTTDLNNSALYQSPSGYVGFGTTTPAFNLSIISQTDPAAVTVEGYGVVGVNFIGRRARGTVGAPSAIQADDNLMTMQGRGYGTTAFSGSSRANLKFFAAENWTDAAQGTYLSFATTPNGSLATAERLRIGPNGYVGIGTTWPTSLLTVAGVVQSTSGGFRFPDGNTQLTAGSLNSVATPLTGNGSSASPLGLPRATSTVDGYLDSADRSTFNNKLNQATADARYVQLTGGTMSNGLVINHTSGTGSSIYGLQVTDNTSNAIYVTENQNWAGIYVRNPMTGSTWGVSGLADSSDGAGVTGSSNDGIGVYAKTINGTALNATVSAGGTGHAGEFNGNVHVYGTLSKTAGSFQIDHPLDPEHKYLYHSFVESPDMKNVYDGVVVLDGNGEAIVTLPDWFGALNRDFRYQLTAIGAPGPNLYIAQKIANNQFKIAGGTPSAEVSWQVTGIRQDAYANAHRIPVEEMKPAAEQGSYLHPAAFNRPVEKRRGYQSEKQRESLGEAPNRR